MPSFEESREAFRENFREYVRVAVKERGYFIQVVVAGVQPRCAYTVGLQSAYGSELVIAGASAILDLDDLRPVFDSVISSGAWDSSSHASGPLGEFAKRPCHKSWVPVLLRACLTFAEGSGVRATQVYPVETFLDVPDLSKSVDDSRESFWLWDQNNWPLTLGPSTEVATSIAVMAGEPITEVARWETDYWEMFGESGPSRMVLTPLPPLVVNDPSLVGALGLDVGKAMMRESPSSDWLAWESKS